MSLADIFTGTELADFISGYKNNPLWQQAQLQLGNQSWINDLVKNAYNVQTTMPVPQQGVAAIDPLRMQGLQSQITAAQGPVQDLYNTAGNTLNQFSGGINPSQQALQQLASGVGNQYDVGTATQFQQAAMPGLEGASAMLNPFATGQMGAQFGQDMASQYKNFIDPSLQGAQQALQNQANMAWNKGSAGLADGGGFMSSGRNAAIGQAIENIGSNLANQQQQLAFNAASDAARLGAQSGLQRYQGALGAAGQLGSLYGQTGLAGAQAGQQSGLANLQSRLGAAQTLGSQGLQSLNLMPQLAKGMMLPGQIQEAAGATLQQQAQNELNALYQNQINQYNQPFKNIQNLQAALGVLGSGNFAPNLQVPNNTMALLNLLGVSPSQLVQGAGSTLSNLLGPTLSNIGDSLGEGLSNVGSWINQNIFGGFFEDGGYLPGRMVGIAGESGPEMVNDQLVSNPTVIQGPAEVTPLEKNNKINASDWF